MGGVILGSIFIIKVSDIYIYDSDYYPQKKKAETKARWKYVFGKKRVISYFIFPLIPILFIVGYILYLIFWKSIIFLGSLTD